MKIMLQNFGFPTARLTGNQIGPLKMGQLIRILTVRVHIDKRHIL